MIEVGYFSIEYKNDLNSFLNNHLESINLKINKYTLLKEYRSKGMKYHFPKTLLLGGLLSVGISIYLYVLDIQSSGVFSYNRTGNSILSSNNTISWFHALIIGIALILSYLGVKVYSQLKKERINKIKRSTKVKRITLVLLIFHTVVISIGIIFL